MLVFLSKELQWWSLRIDQNLISEDQIVAQVRAIDEDSALLRVPTKMKLLILAQEAIIQSLDILLCARGGIR